MLFTYDGVRGCHQFLGTALSAELAQLGIRATIVNLGDTQVVERAAAAFQLEIVRVDLQTWSGKIGASDQPSAVRAIGIVVGIVGRLDGCTAL